MIDQLIRFARRKMYEADDTSRWRDICFGIRACCTPGTEDGLFLLWTSVAGLENPDGTVRDPDSSGAFLSSLRDLTDRELLRAFVPIHDFCDQWLNEQYDERLYRARDVWGALLTETRARECDRGFPILVEPLDLDTADSWKNN